MSYRVVSNDLTSGLVGPLLAAIPALLLNAQYRVPLEYSLITLFSAIIFGGFAARRLTEDKLNVIEKSGVYSVSRRYWGSFAVAGAIFFAAFILIITYLPFQNVVIMSDFFYPLAITYTVTKSLVYRSWERRNKRQIWAARELSAKIFAYPYIYPQN